jgi:prephenate dehydratase
MKELGLLGPQYTYHDLARATFLGELSYAYFNSFESIFAALKKGEIKQALVAIKNNNSGIVGDNQKIIDKEKFKQLEQFDLPIHLCIGCKAKLSLRQINKIYSHPMAIKETQRYFSKYSHITFVASISTAGAIDELNNNKKDGVAVISSIEAIEGNGLHLITKNIEDLSNNTTSFALIGL